MAHAAFCRRGHFAHDEQGQAVFVAAPPYEWHTARCEPDAINADYAYRALASQLGDDPDPAAFRTAVRYSREITRMLRGGRRP